MGARLTQDDSKPFCMPPRGDGWKQFGWLNAEDDENRQWQTILVNTCLVNMNTQKINSKYNSVKGSSSSPKPAASLGRDHDDRQVVPDRHSATRRKQRKVLRIATWNVRTLNQNGKLENVMQEMKRLKLNVLGISEMRWTGKGEINKQGLKIIWSGGSTHQHGVGLIFDKATAKSYIGHWAISDRVILCKFKGSKTQINIIQIYAPTDSSSDTEITNFYAELAQAKGKCKRNEVLIIMGDFNAKVGNGKDGDVVGGHGLGERNERGTMLVDWCRENDVVITNTYFQNHPRRLWTWKSPGDRTRNQIDFILVSHRFRNSILNSKTYPSADCSSDHVPVVSTFRIKLKLLRKQQKRQNFDLEKCRNPTVKKKLLNDVKEKLEHVKQGQPEEMFKEMKTAVQEAMNKFIPKLEQRKQENWMTDEILQMFEIRRKAKNNDKEYKKLDKLVKQKCNNAYENFLNQQCQEAEKLFNISPKEAHQKIKLINKKNKRCSGTGCIKSKSGEVLFEKNLIVNRWEEYIQELYDDEERLGKPLTFDDKLTGPDIIESEVRKALSSMKLGKAVGPDEISIEFLKALGEYGIEILLQLLNSIYKSGQIPEDMRKSVFITLPKKPGAIECENFRTISLMSHVVKILLKICVLRMKSKINTEISEEQYGFMENKGTRNAIYMMRILSERAIEMQQNLYVCFLDYRKAFDRVKHEQMLLMLRSINIDDKELRLIQNLYYEQNAEVRVGDSNTEPIIIKRGVRQGCVLSPFLFNLYSENIMRSIRDIEGIKVGGVNINNIRYADDTVLIATTPEQLQKLVTIVEEESRNVGMELNENKTECMIISKHPNGCKLNIRISNKLIKQVENFKYLGSIIGNEGRCKAEIRTRIAQAKSAFNSLKNVLTNKKLNVKVRVRVLKCYVWPVLLYGCESWTFSKELENNINATEMWFLRRMQRISYRAHKTNQEVLKQTHQDRSLLFTIKQRQLQFFGHIMRQQKLENIVTTGKIIGKRSKGRQRNTFVNQLKQYFSSKEENIFHMAINRITWKNECVMAAEAWIRHGT